jgi:signal transduction histidine kinase
MTTPAPDLQSGNGTRREILSRIIRAARRPHRLPDLLGFVLEEVQTSVEFTSAAVWLYDRAQENWYIAVSRGLSPLAADIRFRPGSALPCLVGERGTPMLIKDLNAERFHRVYPEHYRMHSAVYSPMWIASKPVAVLALYGNETEAFDDEDLAFIEAIGHHVGMAVAFAALEEQRERLAILEERDRLARDLHDGMLQILSSIRLYSIEAGKSIWEGDVEDSRELLTRIQESIDEATGEIRQSIARLRSSAGMEDVTEVARRTSRRLVSSGIRTTLDVASVALPSAVSDALAWICREAANNILKHSHASHAQIVLHEGPGWVELGIADDGTGLSPDPPVDGEMHLGLQMMKERARQAGGSLEIGDRDGGGLSLRCRIAFQQPTG